MKTRGLNKVLLLSLVFSVFTGCQEEEFYEKEYIDGAVEQYEREQRTIEEDDEAEQINDEDQDQGINPGDGDDDGGSTTDDSDDGSGDDDDGIADNDDGMGDDDDGIADNDDGDYDDGNGDNDDGIADNDDDGSNNVPNIVSQSDSFNQNGTQSKIDILWVVDNSGSMHDEQQALADNFNVFIQDFVTKGIDFKMAITTTDRNRGSSSPVQSEINDMAKLTKAKLDQNQNQFISNFQDQIMVGTRGYGIEKGIKSSEVWTDVYANQFLRDDAYFIIVYVSDERDQSEDTVSEHLAQIAAHKSNQGLIKTYSIVDMDNTVSTGYILKGYERYQEMSTLTGGYIANLYDNFASVLGNMGNAIANLADQFPLSKTPYDASGIVVKVNGVETVEWDYNASSNTIKFHATAVPADGSSIEVIYNVQQ